MNRETVRLKNGETRKVTDERMTDNSEKQLIGQIADLMDGWIDKRTRGLID
jgi:hypothetical protein